MNSSQDPFELSAKRVYPTPETHLVVIGTVIVVLAILKLIYLFIFERKEYNFKLKFWVTILGNSYVILTILTSYCQYSDILSFASVRRFDIFTGVFSYFFSVASAIFVFLHWISLLTDVFSVTQRGKLLTKKYVLLFLIAFFIPALILAIVIFIILMVRLKDYKSSASIVMLFKVYIFFILVVGGLMIVLLFVYLFYQLYKMNPESRKTAKKFFIFSFSFATNTFLVGLFQIMYQFYGRGNEKSNNAYTFFVFLFSFQILFIVFPINIYLIRKHFNPNYQRKQPFNFKSTNQTTHNTSETNFETEMETNDSNQKSEPNLSYGSIQP